MSQSLPFLQLQVCDLNYAMHKDGPRRDSTCLWDFRATQTRYKNEISFVSSLDIILSEKRITKALTTFVVRTPPPPPKTGFVASRPYIFGTAREMLVQIAFWRTEGCGEHEKVWNLLSFLWYLDQIFFANGLFMDNRIIVRSSFISFDQATICSFMVHFVD